MIFDKQRVTSYFENIAGEFDSIYDNKGTLLERLINKVFRKGMYERAALTVRECGNVKSKSILDVGCGSGRIALALAEGEAEVTGIDLSSKMIEIANNYLDKMNLEVNAKFICCDFLEGFPGDISFDITLALGVFDYVQDPVPFLSKMKGLTKERIIASYPAKFTFETPIRKIWLWTRHCPVYFYSAKRLTSIYKMAGINNYKIIKMPTGWKIPTDYLVIANA